MSLGRRLSALFDRGRKQDDDPTAALDDSLQAQTALLQQSRRGVADVVTARKRVELQLRRLQEEADRLEREAQAEVDADRDDAARALLVRRAGVLEQSALLEPDADRMRAQEERLQAQVQRLESKVEAFRSQRETLKAAQTAAEAHVRIVEAQAGLSEESADVGLALQRARERTDALQARADAAEELTRTDAATLAWESPGEAAERRMAALTAADGGVEDDLARLRRSRPRPTGRQEEAR
jgi:phage shock protein A